MKEEITIEMAENIGLVTNNNRHSFTVSEKGTVFFERDTILSAIDERNKSPLLSLEDRIYELCREWIKVIKI